MMSNKHSSGADWTVSPPSPQKDDVLLSIGLQTGKLFQLGRDYKRTESEFSLPAEDALRTRKHAAPATPQPSPGTVNDIARKDWLVATVT